MKISTKNCLITEEGHEHTQKASPHVSKVPALALRVSAAEYMLPLHGVHELIITRLIMQSRRLPTMPGCIKVTQVDKYKFKNFIGRNSFLNEKTFLLLIQRGEGR